MNNVKHGDLILKIYQFILILNGEFHIQYLMKQKITIYIYIYRYYKFNVG